VAETKINAQFSNLPRGAVNLNVEGRPVVELAQGFGQMWRKSYRVRLEGTAVEPAQVSRVWRENFAKFWPPGNHLYTTPEGIAPGQTALLNLAMPGGMILATGLRIVRVDDTSFTFMTLLGHMYAGVIIFSAYADAGTTVVQVEPLLRAGDPLFEITMRLGFGHTIEERFWHATLKSLAAHFGVDGKVEQHNELLDTRVQWANVKNILYNAAIWSGLYVLTAPLRAVGDLLRR
jgi:hypothetical protein